jgi:hypothetical protein
MKTPKFLAGTILTLTVGALLAASPVASAEEIFRIETNRSSSRSSSDRELRSRIADLERAVDQLQRKVFELQMGKDYDRPSFTWPGNSYRPVKDITCYLKTPFDGTFMATQSTETAARARTLDKCTSKLNNSVFCKEDNIKCGQ